MPVNPRGNGYQAQVNFKGARYRRDFATRREAELWEAEAKHLLMQGKSPNLGTTARVKSGQPHTIKELVDHVYDTHWSAKATGEIQRINAMAVATIVGAHLPVDKLTKLALDKAKAKLLESGNAQATVNRKLAAISKCLTVAVDMELIARKPKVEKFKESEGRQRRFTAEDEAMAVRFFRHIGNDDMADYVELSLDTGMRQGELLSLTFEGVTADTIQISGRDAKSRKNRTVPLTRRAKAIIARRKADMEAGPKARVLGTLSKRSIHHYWNRLKDTADLADDKQFTPHIMRHEFLSRLADRGLNAAVLQQLAGHESMVTTQRYIHVSGRELVAAIGKLEEAA